METYRKLFDLLSPQERRRALLLLGMILVMAMLDVAGVASIMPFMAVLANPQIIETNRWLAAIYHALNFNEPAAFLFFLGMAVFVALLVSIAFKALTTWALLRFTHMRDYAIGRRLVANYLNQPYEWFLNRHSADLGKTVLSEVGQVINGALIPAMHVIAHSVVVMALIGLLLTVDPFLTLSVTAGLGGTYGAIYLLMRRRVGRLGAQRVKANRQRFRAVQEAFGGIKEVKVAGLEAIFLERYKTPARRFALAQAASQVAAQLPRYLLEALAFGGMLLVLLYLMKSSGGLQEALPLIALYALAGYRMIPALQHVYANFSRLRFSLPALDSFHREFTSLALSPCDYNGQPLQEIQRLPLNKAIRLQNILYTYPLASSPALHDVSIEIPACQVVGIVGTTGSGKTTLVDLLLGILQQQDGSIHVDEKVIEKSNLPSWQKTIGYVPQHIYLADDSVSGNIAFGVAHDSIDMESVIRAAQIANLHEFVTEQLPQAYATTVGERGVRLSGGQRQRIGIARALYHDPEVLVLDEATSALDNLTEQAVMEAVNNLGHRKTIVLIAHRLSTVRECDKIFILEDGRLADQGTYQELLERSAHFRAMTGTY